MSPDEFESRSNSSELGYKDAAGNWRSAGEWKITYADEKWQRNVNAFIAAQSLVNILIALLFILGR